MKNLPQISIIINVYNEANSIEKEILSIQAIILSKIPGSELIIAEDGSNDGTKEIIQKYIKKNEIIHSTSSERKGYSKALRDAFMLAKNPYIFFSDIGGKFDYNDFWKLYEVCNSYSLVIGMRSNRKDRLYRRFLTIGYNLFIKKYFHVQLKDSDSGFRIYKKEIIDKICSEVWINKDLIGSELALRVLYSGGKVGFVPVSYKKRDGISRGLPPLKIPKVIFTVLRNFALLKKTLVADSYKKI